VTPHLTDDELSDALDGRSSPHVAVCAECSTRLEMWRAAQARLRAPVVVPESARDQAVAAVLAASGEAVGGRRGRAARRGRGPARRLTGSWAAAAAVVVVIAAVVGLGVGLAGQRHHRQVSASSVPAAGGPDLGAVDGPSQLAAAVRRAFPPGTSSSGGSTLGGSAGSGAVGGSSGSVSAGEETGGSGTAFGSAGAGTVPGPTGRPPAANGQRSASTTLAPAVITPATVSPPITLASGTCGLPRGTRGSIVFVGTVEYRTVPARVVLVQAGSAEQAIVQSESGCRLLAVVAIVN
jgi:hypothetical protein